MNCKQCSVLPSISQSSGEALFTCNVDLLQNKLLNMLGAEGYSPLTDGEVVKVQVKSFQGLITPLSVRSDIADVKANGLHLLFLKYGESLDFAAFSRRTTCSGLSVC